MAKKYGIEFSLLADPEHELASQFAGLSSDGYPIPAMYIVRPNGSVYLRKIGESKDDRINARELLQHLDRMTGEMGSGRPGVRGYGTPYRLALGLAIGADRLEHEQALAGDFSVMGLRKVGRHLALGLELGSLVLPRRELRAAIPLQAQLPLWSDVGELYVQLPLGVARRVSDNEPSKNAILYGLRVGLGFEINPGLAANLEAALDSSIAVIDDGYASSARVLMRMGVRWNL